MMRTKRIILISCSAILLCVCMIVGATYALFTDSLQTPNHLQAGNLQVELTRTKLTYRVLNNEGYLQTFTDNETVDFSTLNEENVFGLTDDILVAPDSFFEAEMKVRNLGTTAFTYSVLTKLNSECDPEIAEQLLVTVTDSEGHKIFEKSAISNMTEAVLAGTGKLVAKGESDIFTVRVEFVNDNTINNVAMNQKGIFDLLVTAEQAID